ncbi:MULTISPECIES: sensor histidine kinase [Flavobacterium]|uniref:histidine kinase n=1 Tax=Flavobacterium hankyongi TaxID=1176532 RepID=A0ABP9A1C1_9FLAO|nr:ATP-binding protein [Flavobacterium sp. N1846]
MWKENEILRSRLLEEYKIFDTSPEQMYDDITAMAASICNTPIALITLVDKHRQFFKSHFGIEINQTPIEQSICNHTIKSNEAFLEIKDLRIDNRFENHPMVIGEPKIVYYFGVPLISEDGIPFGTLSVINTKIQELTNIQKNALKGLAKQVVYLLELRKKNFLLEAYRRKLEGHSKVMEEFAFIAAHDLRSPLRGVNSFLKLLESKNDHSWDEKDKQYFSFIFENVQRMDKLVLDLLDYAKSYMTHNHNAIVNTKELVSDIFKGLTKEYTINRPELLLSELPTIISSEIALTIIFQNLIANALKYQSGGKTPKIEVSCKENEAEWIFEIKDNGIGIEQDNLAIIFEPFKRLHNQSEFSGSGLGLAACKKVIESLKGTIKVTSEKNNGSRFIFTIPK